MWSSEQEGKGKGEGNMHTNRLHNKFMIFTRTVGRVWGSEWGWGQGRVAEEVQGEGSGEGRSMQTPFPRGMFKGYAWQGQGVGLGFRV